MGAGYLGMVSWVLTHDTAAGAALSVRSWLTLALAALLVVILTAYRTSGLRLLGRAIAEYTAVAVLAVLLTTTSTTADGDHHAKPAHHPGQASTAGQLCPTAVRAVAGGACDYIAELWHQARSKTKADQQAGRRSHPTTTTTPAGR